ncbi:MAG: hypothetical protein ACK4UJ_11440 [Leptonema sp. (in: bacteria)]
MTFIKKIDSIFLFLFFVNLFIYFEYHRIDKIFLKAEDLWNDSLYTNKISQLNVGNIIVMNFNESVSIQQEIDSTKDKKLVIKLIPDKVLFDYLPEIKDDRSSQQQFRKNQKDKLNLIFKMALKITQVNPETNTVLLEGSKQFFYNGVQYRILFRGETNPIFIKNNNISSDYIYNTIFQIDVIETTNQNLQLQNDKIEINEETKRKIFLEYLKKILEEQSINVP